MNALAPKMGKEIFDRMMGLDSNPQSTYLEIEPAQIILILDSLSTVEDEPKHKHLERAIEHRDTVSYEFRGYDKGGNPTETYMSIAPQGEQ